MGFIKWNDPIYDILVIFESDILVQELPISFPDVFRYFNETILQMYY